MTDESLRHGTTADEFRDRPGWYTNSIGTTMCKGVDPPAGYEDVFAAGDIIDDEAKPPAELVEWVQARCNFFGQSQPITGVWDNSTRHNLHQVTRVLDVPPHLHGVICPQVVEALAAE